jgi:WD repeat-containing protein 68
LSVSVVAVCFHFAQTGEELFGCSGDGLRIFRIRETGEEAEMIAKLVPAQISTSPTASTAASRRPSDANIITTNPGASASVGNPGQPRNSAAPITSFDWNRVDPNLIVTSSYDTTCAVWNLNVSVKGDICRFVLMLSFPVLDCFR